MIKLFRCLFGYARLMHLALLLAVCASTKITAQPANVLSPLKGIPGHDFWVDYYVDHDSSGGIRDGHCGTKTYQGHKGTDYLLRSFKTMDSGVGVFAITDGTVLKTSDGHFDRMTKWVTGGLGNMVSVKYNSYLISYGHLRKNSIRVKPGDAVVAGQQIGEVGSSGYSSGPHLHLEIRDSSNKVVDLFAGNCNPDVAPFHMETEYDTDRYIIDLGFVPYIPHSDLLKERYLNGNSFSRNGDSVICFWALMHGLRAGCHVRFEWYKPNDDIHFVYNKIWGENWWFDYASCYIHMPTESGMWTLKYYLEGKRLQTINFFVQ